MIDFPSNECVAYSYQNGVNSAPGRINDCRVVHTDQFVILADRTPVFCSGRFVPENLELNSPNHQGRGETVLRWTATPPGSPPPPWASTATTSG